MSYLHHAKQLTKTHEAVQLLLKIQERGFRSAIIAGGAVRDLYFNQCPRDFDIYVQNPQLSKEFAPKRQPKLDETFWFETCECSDDVSTYYDEDYIRKFQKDEDDDDDCQYHASIHINQVYEMMKTSIKYNIIVVDVEPKTYVESFFDIGLCKAMCDGVKNRYTIDFMTDVMNKTITMCDAAFDKQGFDFSVKRHLPRVRAKYPGFGVIIHPKNLEFIDKENMHLLK